MPKPKNVQKRIDELAHPDADTRRKAAKKLGEYGDCNAVEPLCRALRDADAYVRSDAAWALGSLAPFLGPRHCEMAFEPLREALAGKQRGLRHAAARAIGQLGVQQKNLAPRAVSFILYAAQKSKPEFRHHYIHALTLMGAAAVAPLCVEYSSRRSEIRQECIRQALVFLEQTARLDVAGALLSDPSLTAPQQWDALELLTASRPRNIFAPRHVMDTRRYCETMAANPRAPEPARRGARAVLDYLSLGRASQRQEPTDAAQLLRMAEGTNKSEESGEDLLRGSSSVGVPHSRRTAAWHTQFQLFLDKLRRKMGLS